MLKRSIVWLLCAARCMHGTQGVGQCGNIFQRQPCGHPAQRSDGARPGFRGDDSNPAAMASRNTRPAASRAALMKLPNTAIQSRGCSQNPGRRTRHLALTAVPPVLRPGPPAPAYPAVAAFKGVHQEAKPLVRSMRPMEPNTQASCASCLPPANACAHRLRADRQGPVARSGGVAQRRRNGVQLPRRDGYQCDPDGHAAGACSACAAWQPAKPGPAGPTLRPGPCSHH